MTLDPGSRARLTPRSRDRFPGDSLFARVARAACEAGCLPRKELYESWEMARRVRRHYRGGRIVDLCCGHGLLAHLLLLLDDASPSAVAVDTRIPAVARRLQDCLVTAWPRLAGRVALAESALDQVEIHAGDLVVSAHACGELTDQILARAVAAQARVAVLPCCQHLSRDAANPLRGWLDGPLAVDVARATVLQSRGYAVRTLRIPASITPKNRILMGEPL